MKKQLPSIAIPIISLLAGLLAVQASGLFTKSAPGKNQFPRSVNLAIRQSADRLLDLSGDSTSNIPPVSQVSASEYILRIESNLNYDSLPKILDAAFQQFDIREKYHVAVLDCMTDHLILGYSFETLAEGSPPCGGREKNAGCYNLSVTFPDLAGKENPKSWAWGVILGLTTFVSGFLFFKKNNKERRSGASIALPVPPELLQVGNTKIDPVKLSLIVGSEQHALTFREAKLLQFLAERPNQVLERGAILAAVWGDEGIIVGRSLDVFVSRLRKILQKDPSLKITSVHGVGYRFEVQVTR